MITVGDHSGIGYALTVEDHIAPHFRPRLAHVFAPNVDPSQSGERSRCEAVSLLISTCAIIHTNHTLTRRHWCAWRRSRRLHSFPSF